MEETIKKAMEIFGGLKTETLSEGDALLFLAHHEGEIHFGIGGTEKSLVTAIVRNMLYDADFERIVRLLVFYFNQYRKSGEES
jgi:hypothetical protein